MPHHPIPRRGLTWYSQVPNSQQQGLELNTKWAESAHMWRWLRGLGLAGSARLVCLSHLFCSPSVQVAGDRTSG